MDSKCQNVTVNLDSRRAKVNNMLVFARTSSGTLSVFCFSELDR